MNKFRETLESKVVRLYLRIIFIAPYSVGRSGSHLSLIRLFLHIPIKLILSAGK